MSNKPSSEHERREAYRRHRAMQAAFASDVETAIATAECAGLPSIAVVHLLLTKAYVKMEQSYPDIPADKRAVWFSYLVAMITTDVERALHGEL